MRGYEDAITGAKIEMSSGPSSGLQDTAAENNPSLGILPWLYSPPKAQKSDSAG